MTFLWYQWSSPTLLRLIFPKHFSPWRTFTLFFRISIFIYVAFYTLGSRQHRAFWMKWSNNALLQNPGKGEQAPHCLNSTEHHSLWNNESHLLPLHEDWCFLASIPSSPVKLPHTLIGAALPLLSCLQLHSLPWGFKHELRALAGISEAPKLPSNIRSPQVPEHQETETCVVGWGLEA